MSGDHFAKLEYEIENFDPQTASSLSRHLSGITGIGNVQVDESTGRVYVETNLPSSDISKLIETKTQSLAALRGLGPCSPNSSTVDVDSAVAELTTSAINGVVRFVQLNQDVCAVDGVIDGLVPGSYAIDVYEYGDLSDHFNKLGKVFDPSGTGSETSADKRTLAGELGVIEADERRRSTFRRVIEERLKVWDIIGRSFCVSSLASSNDELPRRNEKLACGIIARSSNLFQNEKKICSCSGRTLWQEVRDKN